MSIAAARVERLDRVVGVADRVLRGVLGVAFAGILVAAVVQVVGRYIPGFTFTGSEEIARYLMIATAFLAIPVLAWGRLQIAVDALAHYLPAGWPKRWLHRVILLVELAFYVLFANYAWFVWAGYASTGQATTSLGIPLAWPTSLVVVGTALGALVTIVLIVRSFLAPVVDKRPATTDVVGDERTVA